MNKRRKSSLQGTRQASRAGRLVESDTNAEAALERVRQDMLGYFGRGQGECWKLGECYNKVVREKLAEKAGYDHAGEYFDAKLDVIPQSTLSAYGRVARAFAQDIAVQYGMSKLNLLLRWCKLRKLDPPRAIPGPWSSRCPGRTGRCARSRSHR